MVAKAKKAPIGSYPADKRATKRDFMQYRLDWSPVLALGFPAEWIGAELYVSLDDVRRVVISVHTTGTHEHYNRLAAKVVSKTAGPIDERSFAFRAFLGNVGRADDRADGPNRHPHNDPALNRIDVPFEVISTCAWDWYIAVPATTLPLMEAVAAYVRTFA